MSTPFTAPPVWAAILDSCSDLMALLDVQGCVVWANAALTRSLGDATAQQSVGRSVTQLIGQGDARDRCLTCLAQGQGFEPVELRWQPRHGDIRVMVTHVRVLTKPERSGSTAWALLVMRDETELRRLRDDAFNNADALLKIAVDLGQIAVWRHDLQLNRIFYSDHAFQLLGLPRVPQGLSLDEVRALIHPDDLPQVVVAAEQSLHTTEPVDMQARYRRADGRWLDVLTRRVVNRGPDGRPKEFIGVALDISAQVEKLRQASDLTQRLEIAIASAGVGIWSLRHEDERPTWNDQMFRITGWPVARGAATITEWRDEIVHPDDRASQLSLQDANVSGGTPNEQGFRILRPDGEVRWLVNRVRHDRHGDTMMLFGVTLDVTERVRAEAALRSINERTALAARSVGIGTWEWNVVTGEAVWDEAMFRLRGLAPRAQALNAEERLATVHPDDAHAVRWELNSAVTNPGTTAYEFRVVWPDGRVRWLASRSTPAPDNQGRMIRRIGVNWDVTESRDAERSRREREVALRESQAKSEFLSRMSHELRTPLNAVLGFARLLMMDQRGMQPHQTDKLSHIHSAGEHLLALIDDVLDLSSLESNQLRLQLEPVSLADVIHETLPLVESLALSHSVHIEVGDVDATLVADRIRLRQMLINLLSNAIKYNRPQGRVTIRAERRQDEVLLQVQDTGRGMNPAQLTQLFKPFNRLGMEREEIPGTGIGLAVVKALAVRMNGSVQVRSEPGTGSTFSVTLPRSHDAAPATSTPVTTPPPAQSPARSGHLLYIEDNPVNVLLVEELIRMRPGLILHSAPTGLAGVERATALQPDLILIDIQLPDIDGFEVLQRLKQDPLTASIDCIALSANAMPEDIARATAAGFADYWTKPIDFSAFLSALDQRFPGA